MRIKTLVFVLAALAPLSALAQFDFGGGESGPAWSTFKLNPKTKVKLNFPNTGVDMIVSWFSKTSGITIIKDPALTGTLNIVSAKPVVLTEAFSILNTTLGLKNFELKKEGNYLVIRSRQQQQQSRMPSFDPKMLEGLGGLQGQLKVYTIQYANASQVARVVNDVFSTATNPLDQIQQMFQGFGGGGNQGGGRFNRGGFGQGGPGNRGNRNGFGGGGFGGFGGNQAVVRASSDDFSNSVIVNAPQAQQQQVGDLIRQLDRQTDQPQQAKVFKLEFASSDDLAPVVQNVLAQNAPRGKGGISAQNVPIEQRFQQAARFGNAQAAFGTVVSEPRTNSLVVTATDENLKLVEAVIKELDTDVKVSNSTFVFQLSNARADQIATLMQQAFGSRTVNGQNNNRNFGTTNQNQNRNLNNNNQNRNNNNGNRGGGLGGEQIDPDAKDLDLHTNADGSLPTEVMVQQGGFFGGGGQQQRRNTGQNGNETGRDANGRLVNIRDLQGQITVIPDVNTNSIIVVATPENMELIKQVLAQLDKIPEQVMIETMIIEATLDSSSQFGVEWKYAQANALGNNTGTGTGEGNFGLQTTTPPLQGFRYTLTGGALTGFINMLQTDKKFQVLSTPRIFTSNGIQAQINISQSIPYVLSTRTDTSGALTFNYAFQDVGIVLTVTPRITSNGYVTMEVTQTANDLQGFTDFNAPIVNQRQADTTVSVKDGETIILGGIIRKDINSTVKKLPLLGDIPILGNLFRSTSKSNVKTELLVFLTPRVVKDADEARKLRDEEFKRMSAPTQKTLAPELRRNYDPDKDKKHSNPPPDTTGKGGGGN